MASDAGVGDREVPFLDVQPGDGSTAGTLTVTAPDGTETSPAVTAGAAVDGVVRLTAAAVTYDQAGKWVLHWEVTGTGAGAEDVEVYIVASPVAGGPTWIPGRTQVAKYVPGRTLSRDVETHEETFSSTTFPSGVIVDKLIADAVARVQMRTGELDENLFSAASATVSVLSACAVERGYPAERDEQSLQRAKDLCEQGQRMLDDLVIANRQPDDPGNANALLPLYAFPGAVEWGDESFI